MQEEEKDSKDEGKLRTLSINHTDNTRQGIGLSRVLSKIMGRIAHLRPISRSINVHLSFLYS
jgi:hypothetical protein